MPVFFGVSDVLDFHTEQIELYGGVHGLRDIKLLESALAMPMAGFENDYLHVFPFEMAAAYMFHLIQDHPFIDGNKRTGLATCLYFLGMNGKEIEVAPDDLERFVRSVAEGTVQKSEIARFLQEHGKEAVA
jgi:death-on-curing protein